jgi:hypothetical protein
MQIFFKGALGHGHHLEHHRLSIEAVRLAHLYLIIPDTAILAICRCFSAIIVVWLVVNLITVLSICKPFVAAWDVLSKCD